MKSHSPSSDLRATWNDYTLAWQAPSDAERRSLFVRCLNPTCDYADPIVEVTGWHALADYMNDLQAQIPGVHFHTTRFVSHHGTSVAWWEMRDGHESVLGEGVSQGEYGADGRLRRMRGYFDVPGAT